MHPLARRKPCRPRHAIPAALALLLSAAACGGAPTAEPPAPTEGTAAQPSAPAAQGATAAPSSLEDVYAQLDGLTGEQRRSALIDLAAGECAEPIDLWTVINVETTQPMLDQFIQDTGVRAQLHRAAELHLRIMEEERANIANVADVIAINDYDLETITREGILAPLDTPVTEGNSAVHDTWAGVDRLVYIAAWADSLDNPPTTWDEVLSADSLAYQLDDVNWFATLVNDYYVAERGMTEREAVDMIKDAVSGAQIVDGHTLGAQLLASGEYDVASSLYLYRIRGLIEEGAPIAWEPAVEPLIDRHTGVGIHHRTPCPASALLLTEYLLTDFQAMLPDSGRQPALEDADNSVPEQYQVIPTNIDIVLDEYDKWYGYHGEITESVGGEVLEE